MFWQALASVRMREVKVLKEETSSKKSPGTVKEETEEKDEVRPRFYHGAHCGGLCSRPHD